ncbi:MAG: competence/damage-inducible protein A [Halofilum sp. (in: g-proteobacteria)]
MSSDSLEVGLIIVGDEILSGRRTDRHLSAIIERLNARGMELSWARYIGDDRLRLAALLRETMASDALVFCCGGIGATPDDVTRQAASDAAGAPLERHAEGEHILRERFGEDATDSRLRMIDFPAGSELIPNPVNRVPGFRLHRHCFVPGFPKMAWPMIEWALDTHFAEHARDPAVSRAVRVDAKESDLIPLLEALGEAYPAVRFSSLPEMRDGGGYVVELGVSGPAADVDTAFAALERRLDADGVRRSSA